LRPDIVVSQHADATSSNRDCGKEREEVPAGDHTNDMRVGPGQGIGIGENGTRCPSGTWFMGLPFHDVTPGLMAMIDKIT
jgi:hypothetical protein